MNNRDEIPLQFWLTDEGRTILSTAQNLLLKTKHDTLRAGIQLRKKMNCAPKIASEALEIVLCREKAAHFGDWAQHGFFTRQSLEQATAPIIAKHHAERFRGCRHVLEICTGAGFDTAALAQVAQAVTTIEASESLAAMARLNLVAQGITNVKVICGLAEEVCTELDLTAFDGLWSDPSRRTAQGGRIASPDDYAPSLRWLQGLKIQGLKGIKIAPAVNCEGHYLQETLLGEIWRREWIGLGNECREQILWCGRRELFGSFLDGTVSLINDSGIQSQWNPPYQSMFVESDSIYWNGDDSTLAGMYILEPHAALIRTGHLAEFAVEQGFLMFDEQIAYMLSSQKPSESPWYQAFEIQEIFTFHYAKLKERLKSRSWGNRLEIKKRGFPETPDEIRRKLKLPSSPENGVLFCTRKGQRHWAILAKRLSLFQS